MYHSKYYKYFIKKLIFVVIFFAFTEMITFGNTNTSTCITLHIAKFFFLYYSNNILLCIFIQMHDIHFMNKIFEFYTNAAENLTYVNLQAMHNI